MTTLSIDSLTTDPSGSENGLVVRNIPSGTQTVEITDGYGNVLGTSNNPLVTSSGSSARVAKTFYVNNQLGTGFFSEAMVTLTPTSDFTAGSTGTSFGVTSGKTLRIQNIIVTLASGAPSVGTVKVRISSSGSVTTSSSPIATFTSENFLTNVSFPDGLELSGSMQLGVSFKSGNSSQGFDCYIVGYEY